MSNWYADLMDREDDGANPFARHAAPSNPALIAHIRAGGSPLNFGGTRTSGDTGVALGKAYTVIDARAASSKKGGAT